MLRLSPIGVNDRGNPGLDLRRIPLFAVALRPSRMGSTMPPNRMERRQYERIAVELPGDLRLGDKVSSVIVKELSASGATIETSKHFPYSVALTLQIEGAGDFEAEQAWWSKNHDVGPKSTDTDLETRGTVRVGLKFSEIHRGIYEAARRLSVVQRDA